MLVSRLQGHRSDGKRCFCWGKQATGPKKRPRWEQPTRYRLHSGPRSSNPLERPSNRLVRGAFHTSRRAPDARPEFVGQPVTIRCSLRRAPGFVGAHLFFSLPAITRRWVGFVCDPRGGGGLSECCPVGSTRQSAKRFAKRVPVGQKPLRARRRAERGSPLRSRARAPGRQGHGRDDPGVVVARTLGRTGATVRFASGGLLTQWELRRAHGRGGAQNCARKRGSFSNIVRMFGIPNLIIAMRSMPIPKAKPVSWSGSRPQCRNTSG